MKVRSRKITLQKRTIIISDIHGNGHLLDHLLKKCHYQAGVDTLILLGDLIEKGKNSLETLRQVMRLSQHEHVYTVMGNCDAIPVQLFHNEETEDIYHYLMHAPWSGKTLIQEMAEVLSIDLRKDYIAAFHSIVDAFSDEFAFLDQLPHVIESEHHLFVHAGLETEESPYAADAFTIMKNDRFADQKISFQKVLVCGHTPVVNYQKGILSSNPLFDDKRNIISVDGGCGVRKDGQLNALILDHGNLSYFYEDDLPKRKISDHYTAPVCPVHSINWFSRCVELLEESATEAVCRQLESNEILHVPLDYLYRSKGNLCCEDFTDYRMSVKKGDIVGVIRYWNDEVYVKKDGILGWIPKKILL